MGKVKEGSSVGVQGSAKRRPSTQALLASLRKRAAELAKEANKEASQAATHRADAAWYRRRAHNLGPELLNSARQSEAKALVAAAVSGTKSEQALSLQSTLR